MMNAANKVRGIYRIDIFLLETVISEIDSNIDSTLYFE